MNPFGVKIFSLRAFPGFSLLAKPGLKLAIAFGVFSN